MTFTNPRFAFFGTPLFAEIILDELEAAGYSPALVVTAPDKPKGRKLIVTPSAVKRWAQKRNIPVFTPQKLNDEDFLSELNKAACDLFIVAAYGKIIPQVLLDMPKYHVLNVHPSLLPKFRGPSPIESFILSSEPYTGVTIIELDAKMDNGPIVAMRERVVKEQYPRRPSVDELTLDLAHFGGTLLAEIIPEWTGGLKATPQDHARATFTKKIEKGDGLIDLEHGDPLENYKKTRALDTYFFIKRHEKTIRVRVTDADFVDGKFEILRVVPEGKKEMVYKDFLRGL